MRVTNIEFIVLQTIFQVFIFANGMITGVIFYRKLIMLFIIVLDYLMMIINCEMFYLFQMKPSTATATATKSISSSPSSKSKSKKSSSSSSSSSSSTSNQHSSTAHTNSSAQQPITVQANLNHLTNNNDHASPSSSNRDKNT